MTKLVCPKHGHPLVDPGCVTCIIEKHEAQTAKAAAIREAEQRVLAIADATATCWSRFRGAYFTTP